MAKKKPDIEDSEDGGEAAVERDVERVRNASKMADEKPVSSDDGDNEDTEIDLDAAPDDDEPERPSRADRRRERGQNLVAEATARAEAAERRAAEAERMAREAMSRLPPPAPKEDPHDAELKKAYTDQRSLYREYEARKASGGLTKEDIADFEQRGMEIEQRKYTAIARKTSGGQQGVSPDEVIARVRQQQLAEEHSDVISNPQYFRWAQGRMQQEIAEGKADTKATVDAVMDMARRKFGLMPRGGRPAPSDATKRRLGGLSRGGGTPSGDDRNVVTMTKELRTLADAAYPHIKDERKRHEMWAQKTGRRLSSQGKLTG